MEENMPGNICQGNFRFNFNLSQKRLLQQLGIAKEPKFFAEILIS